MPAKKNNLRESMEKLEGIISWFDSQKEVDIEMGLEKVKEGALLLKYSKDRLKEVENEFEEIKKDVTIDSDTE